MKKTVAFILALMMIFALCACEYMDEPDEKTVTPEFDLSVNFENADDEAKLDDNTVVYKQSITNVSVSSENNHDAARRINKTLDALQKEFSDAAQEIKEAALSQGGSTEGTEVQDETALADTSGKAPVIFGYTCNAEILRCDTSVLSIGYYIYSYSGGVHGMSAFKTVNFDSNSGEQLSMESISPDAEKFSAFLVNYMISLASGDEYMLNGERVIDDDDRLAASLPQLLNDDSWYFAEDELVIFANPYAIAPYAAGIVKFAIPYSTLEEFLDAKYMPVSLEGDAGIVLAEDGVSCDRSRLIILDTVTLDKDAQSVIVSAEDTVYNVKLYYMRQNELDSTPETVCVWNRNYLSSGEAVELISFIPDLQPKVYLDYTLADGTVITRGIFQSGKDGSIILIEPDTDSAA